MVLRSLFAVLLAVVVAAGAYIIFDVYSTKQASFEGGGETQSAPPPAEKADAEAPPPEEEPADLAEPTTDTQDTDRAVAESDREKAAKKKSVDREKRAKVPTKPRVPQIAYDSPPMQGERPDLPTPAAPPPAVTEDTRGLVPPAAPAGGTITGQSAPPPENIPLTKEETAEEVADGAAPPEDAEEAAAAPADPWDIVPVYYGTDREQEAKDNRLDYSSKRGRRLELGRALVTIPKVHQAPAIERPWAMRIPYINVTLYEEEEDPERHFTLKSVTSLTEEEFLTLVRERLAASKLYKDHALIFIHGYNTTFEYAIYRTAQISYDLEFDGAPFSYSWPSGGGLASYTYDRESAAQAEPYLREFIELVAKKTGAKHVSIIAHSMGNQVALRVLRDINRSKPNDVKISQVILAAPDVDRDAFANITRELEGLAKGVTLYAAANDRALQVSRNFNGGIPRAGDVPTDGPLILQGIDTVDATAASMDSLGLNHSGYAESNEILKDIGRLIKNGIRPPSTRTPALEVVTGDTGTYWRYP